MRRKAGPQVVRGAVKYYCHDKRDYIIMTRKAYSMRAVSGSRVWPMESRNRCKLSFSSAGRASSGGRVNCKTVAIS